MSACLLPNCKWRLTAEPDGHLVPKAVWPRKRDEDGAWCDDTGDDGDHDDQREED